MYAYSSSTLCFKAHLKSTHSAFKTTLINSAGQKKILKLDAFRVLGVWWVCFLLQQTFSDNHLITLTHIHSNMYPSKPPLNRFACFKATAHSLVRTYLIGFSFISQYIVWKLRLCSSVAETNQSSPHTVITHTMRDRLTSDRICSTRVPLHCKSI